MNYSRFASESYLKYFVHTPKLYPFLFQLAVEKIAKRAFTRGQNSDSTALVSAKFNTVKRRRLLARLPEFEQVHVPLENLLALPKLNLRISADTMDFRPIRVTLATTSVILDETVFEERHQDLEDIFAANRFIWLFEILHQRATDRALNVAVRMILCWIEQNPAPLENARFESYSISERVIAWLFFLMFVKERIEIDEDTYHLISGSISLQLEHLVQNLEYHGPRTNNHILNNARALYMSGTLLGLDSLAAFGKDIFLTEHGNIIQNGVMIEGSSHYQFLLTKNITEMHLVARLSGDGEFEQRLGSLLSGMFDVCARLQSRFQGGHYPLFGDISPDMAPDWFCGRPFHQNASGCSKWFDLFGYEPRVGQVTELPDIETLSVADEPGWRYISAGDFEAWLNLRSGRIPGHAHNDNGSIVIFFKGEPVILDLGLSTYRHTELSVQQKGTVAHNVPIVNGYEPDIAKDSLLYGSNLNSEAELKMSSATSASYQIKYAEQRIIFARTIALAGGKCVISDRIESARRNTDVNLFWHFAQDLRQEGDFAFRSGNTRIEIESEGAVGLTVMNSHRACCRYGNETPVHSIHMQAKSENPVRFRLIMCPVPEGSA